MRVSVIIIAAMLMIGTAKGEEHRDNVYFSINSLTNLVVTNRSANPVGIGVFVAHTPLASTNTISFTHISADLAFTNIFLSVTNLNTVNLTITRNLFDGIAQEKGDILEIDTTSPVDQRGFYSNVKLR